MIFRKNNYYKIPKWRKYVKIILFILAVIAVFLAGFFLGELFVIIF